MADTMTRYVLPSELVEMSQPDRDRHMEELVDAGMNHGPRWDVLFRVWVLFGSGGENRG